jgi:hypothetical protein
MRKLKKNFLINAGAHLAKYLFFNYISFFLFNAICFRGTSTRVRVMVSP